MPFPFQPNLVGVNPPSRRNRITRLAAGDSLILRDTVEDFDGRPVTPDNSILSFALKDQRFSEDTIWTGGWFDGIMQVNNRPGCIEVTVPDEVTKILRRGAYIHSLLVSDKFGNRRKTRMSGEILVEYEATSPHTSIPYKDGADSTQSYQHVSSDSRYVKGIKSGDDTYTPDKSGIVYLPPQSGSGEMVLPLDGKNYRMMLKLVDGQPVSYWVETTLPSSTCRAFLDGQMYYLKLVNLDGVLTSYWVKDGEV